MTDKKIKILTLSDHPLSPSGVGTQTKYFIVELLKTGKYQFISFGGAIKHNDYNPQKTEEYGDDWVIYPVDGYGNPEQIRSILRTTKPDILWFMTDPRFYFWLWEMENEVRSMIPMVYYHVWDNYPYPNYNKTWYDSTDAIATISKLTSDVVRTVSPSVQERYIPHAIPEQVFRKLPSEQVDAIRKSNLGLSKDDFLVFWNSRNARRKQSGSLIFWFADFLKELKKKHPNQKAQLIMHTDPFDPNGQQLYSIIEKLGMFNGEVKISTEKLNADQLAAFYNVADVTMGVSDAEGFGLSTLESLACGTPIITTMTGGLQEQVQKGFDINHENTLKRNRENKGIKLYDHGIGIEPSSKAIIGSQQVPYIYEDRINGDDVVEALMTMYELGKEGREKLGEAALKHISESYNFENFAKSWDEFITEIHEKHGSWENRKNYKSWEMIKV